MKRKIILSLFAIFVLFTIGALTAVMYITRTTSELNRIIELHQVEQLRKSLVMNLQNVQSSLYAINTPFSQELDYVVENVARLEESAQKCTSCHHPPRLSERIERVQYLIQDYENKLSYFITISANFERLKTLKSNAVVVGNELLTMTEEMSHDASDSLNEQKRKAVMEFDDVRIILFVTVMSTFFLGIILAVRLTRSVTRPVNALVNATRMIASGNFGSTISYKDKTEFGELAGHFNDMSTAIRDGYEKIQKEITERLQAQEALVKSEEFLNIMFDSIREPFCIFDREFRIIKMNEAYAEIKHKRAGEIVGKKCYELLYNRSSICENCVVEKTFISSDPCAKDKCVTFDNDMKIWIEIYTYPIFNEEKRVSHVIEYIRDITDRKLAEEALRESEERYVLSARGANDGLWDWDMKSNVVYYSPRWKSMLGYEDKEITNTPTEWLDRIHPADRMQVETELTAHINNHIPNFKNEHRILHKDGAYRWVLVRGLAVRDASVNAYRMAGSMTDVTEQKMVEEQLMFDALHDSLTNLPNRTLFMDRLEHSVNREKRNMEYLFAVLFLDVDRFKVLNDSLGHTVGDKMLTAISHRLQESLRPGDTVARLGGDEFAILLEDLKDKNEALIIAERMQEKLKMPFNLNNREVFTSASIGITFSTTGYDHPENLLRDADIAMYHAKSKGSARYEVFDKGMYANALARLQLETDLRQAVKQNEFQLHYQPIVSLETGEIASLEALIRWKHPTNGLILPEEFIPTAEETGLIIPMGEWTIYEACRQISVWHDKFPSNPPLTVSVNISSKQVLPSLISHIKHILQKTGLEPTSLVLEITESMLMENAATFAPLLSKLKDMNVRLHIDDFGTGYSSLSYLHNFPVDVLKIDRSFVNRLDFNGENLEIVKAITTLAHSLNMHVVAEGVETENQLEQLRALKCDYMQGYYFSRPLDSKGVEKLLQQSRSHLVEIKS